MTMGLARLDAGHWIEPDDALPAYYENKLAQRELLGDAVYRALPESAAAQRELHGLLLRHLLNDHGHDYRRSEQQLLVPELGLCWAIESEQPLWQASLWVQDDICLLQDSARGYRLTAVSLCAASFWRLEEKIGHTLDRIHDPVPGFSQQLAPQVDRFFRHIKPEYPVWRGNWSVVASQNLNQRTDLQAPLAPEAPLYVRVERQSLRRLPQTRAIAFTIRVYLYPLSGLVGDAPVWRALEQALQGLSPQQRHYKGIDNVLPALRNLGLV
jgi:hypothetical protein